MSQKIAQGCADARFNRQWQRARPLRQAGRGGGGFARAAQIADCAEPRRFQRQQILIRQPVQGIGPEQHPMAQSLALMATPAPQITEVGGTFKRDKAGQNLGHERFMPESAALAMRRDCFT
jgi:hypothetical protein